MTEKKSEAMAGAFLEEANTQQWSEDVQRITQALESDMPFCFTILGMFRRHQKKVMSNFKLSRNSVKLGDLPQKLVEQILRLKLGQFELHELSKKMVDADKSGQRQICLWLLKRNNACELPVKEMLVKNVTSLCLKKMSKKRVKVLQRYLEAQCVPSVNLNFNTVLGEFGFVSKDIDSESDPISAIVHWDTKQSVRLPYKAEFDRCEMKLWQITQMVAHARRA